MSLKTIANLKTDIDTMKSALTEKNIEIQELRSENLSFKELAEHRALENSRCKNDIQILNENFTRSVEDKENYEREINIMIEEKRHRIREIQSFTETVNELMMRNSELERLVKNYEHDKDKLSKNNFEQKSNIESVK